MGGSPNDGINVAAETSGDLCHRGDGLQPDYHSELSVEKNKMKIFEGLNNSKNMVFNVKKP
jgi:hypothetical protein